MNNALYRLVYFSRSAMTQNDDALTPEIDAILECSRRNNESVGVTGALMFNEQCFAQVLEGPHTAIQETFERIQCDERHEDVTVLSFGPASERGFGHWSMAYIGDAVQQRARFAYIRQASEFDARALDGDTIYQTLRDNMADIELYG